MVLSEKALKNVMKELQYARASKDTPIYVKKDGSNATLFTSAAVDPKWQNAGTLYEIIQTGIEVLNS